MKLWLDDIRPPWRHGCLGWDWAKTADEAIALLKTGLVERASLDHDLSPEHYPMSGVSTTEYKEKTGYSVVCFMEEQGIWPVNGVTVHSMNPVGQERMATVIARYYGGEPRRFIRPAVDQPS